MKKVVVIIEKTKTGYSAYADNIKDVVVATTGDTFAELMSNLREAFSLQFTAAEIKKIGIEYRLDIQQLFEYYPTINLSAFADYIHMNKSLLSQYAKGIKTPSAKQQARILNGIHSLGKEYFSVNLAMN